MAGRILRDGYRGAGVRGGVDRDDTSRRTMTDLYAGIDEPTCNRCHKLIIAGEWLEGANEKYCADCEELEHLSVAPWHGPIVTVEIPEGGISHQEGPIDGVPHKGEQLK